MTFTDTIIDNAFHGGYIAGRYLIERGHRDIGIIPGPLESEIPGGGRLQGLFKSHGRSENYGKKKSGLCKVTLNLNLVTKP